MSGARAPVYTQDDNNTDQCPASVETMNKDEIEWSYLTMNGRCQM